MAETIDAINGLSDGHFEHRIIRQRRADGSVKERSIYVPDEEAHEEGLKMLDFFYRAHVLDTSELRPETFVSGGLPGTEVADNVLPHRENKLFYLLDIENAFPSVDISLLRTRLYHRLPKVYESVSDFLHHYGTVRHVPGLPQGAPTSPYLFNFYLKAMDKDMDEFCASQGLTYSRYLDDITVSAPEETGVLGEKARRTIREIVEFTPGMKLSPQKARLHRLSNGPVTITGMSLYPNGRIQASPKIIGQASAVFSEISASLGAGDWMTEHHLAVLHGHHGALKGLSIAPYGWSVRREMRRYRVLVEEVKKQMVLQEEAPLMHRVAERQVATYAKARRIEEYARRRSPSPLAEVIDFYRTEYTWHEPELHVLLALFYHPILYQQFMEDANQALDQAAELYASHAEMEAILKHPRNKDNGLFDLLPSVDIASADRARERGEQLFAEAQYIGSHAIDAWALWRDDDEIDNG